VTTTGATTTTHKESPEPEAAHLPRSTRPRQRRTGSATSSLSGSTLRDDERDRSATLATRSSTAQHRASRTWPARERTGRRLAIGVGVPQCRLA
jgi:hypothetical protein